jgi:DNA polymerase-3 subunit gamma/tau
MPYTVLARRYRSSTFDEVIGQEHVAQTLKKAIASDRIAHAYLFCGTRGTGKTSMARILAKALNCTKGEKPTPEPCNKCASCLAIARGEDMSVIEIDAASNTGVDNIREVIENAYTRAPGRFKIYIIDEVHMLSKNAFNALLKTLEEPPEHVKFILATTEPEKVLPTILSRCQRYDFRNISTREIADHLKDVCKQEKVKADDDALLLVAKAGAGSMRDALSLLDRLLSVGEKQLSIGMIEQMLGMPRAQVIFDLAGAIGRGDVKQTLQIAGKLIADGLSVDSLVGALVDHLRNLMILRAVGPGSDMVEMPGMSDSELQKQAGQFDTVALSQDVAILEELRRSLRTTQAGRALLDATLVRLALADQFASVATMLEGNGSPTAAITPALKKNADRAPVTAPAPISDDNDNGDDDDDDDDLPRPGKVWENNGTDLAALVKQQVASNVEPVNPTDFDNVMSRLRRAVHDRSPAIDGFLMHGRFVGVEDGVAVIRYGADHEAAATMLDRNGKRDVIQSELSQLLGEPVGVKFLVEAEAQSPVSARTQVAVTTPRPIVHREIRVAPAPPVQQGIRITPELREELKSAEPLIRTLIDDFGAEIVKVE